ncbi:response regulator [Oceaniglobus ichthyenteri]|uniref:response regulator n=1 Tax=Oceaniglobus ichthyenteri TaxID=2136177 RepID=UPI000D3ABC19|nr:response regulator [Oceaniglobus ichthyenteri]
MSRPENSHNILVVEDEWLIAIDMQMMIEDLGYRVVGPASNVAAAMNLIENHKIDAAFLDITLGPETSFTIAEKLDALAVPITFVSAYAKKEIPLQFRQFDLKSKPITLHVLARQLRKMLGKKT